MRAKVGLEEAQTAIFHQNMQFDFFFNDINVKLIKIPNWENILQFLGVILWSDSLKVRKRNNKFYELRLSHGKKALEPKKKDKFFTKKKII